MKQAYHISMSRMLRLRGLHADCLKDLQRFLRHDDPIRREAFFALGQYGVVKSDLVGLITTYPEDTELIYNARALAVSFLCWFALRNLLSSATVCSGAPAKPLPARVKCSTVDLLRSEGGDLPDAAA